jgi:hypothetical protein
MTGLALLALAGHGHGLQSSQHGDAVKRAVAWLVKLRERSVQPFVGILSEIPSTIIGPFDHAIAAQALAEQYALSRRLKEELPDIRAALVSAAGEIVSKQTPSGGWDFRDGTGFDAYGAGDLCLTAWQLSALGACRGQEIKIPGSPAAFKKAGKYLESRRTPGGGFGMLDRTMRDNAWKLTGAGVCGLEVCFPLSPQKTEREALKWLSAEVSKAPPKWTVDCHLDAWYFNSLAYYAGDEAGWKVWREGCESQVLANQSPDGSWKNEQNAGEGRGSVVEYLENREGSGIIRASLAILILETPLRTNRLSLPR